MSESDYVPVRRSERFASKMALRIGPAARSEELYVTIVLRRRPDGAALPSMDELSAGDWTRRRRLSRSECSALYGASDDDIAAVSAFAAAHGLVVVEANAARRSVIVRATAQQMGEAFRVDLGVYEHNGDCSGQKSALRYRDRDGAAYVPTELSAIVVGVYGLDNCPVARSNAGAPANTVPLKLSLVKKLYRFPSNPADGQVIGIVSATGYSKADIKEYCDENAIPMPRIIEVSIGGAVNHPMPEVETTQNICIAAHAALGATIAVYFVKNDEAGWRELMARVVHPDDDDPQCSVLCSSFYLADGDDDQSLAQAGISPCFPDELSGLFQEAAVQHITVCVASGDDGSRSRIDGTLAHVQYPASDPWVLSVGGTTIGNIKGAAFDEYVWNDFSEGVEQATGGGVSDHFAMPAYQATANVPVSVNGARRGRGVPDVAANANPSSGYTIYVKDPGGMSAPTRSSGTSMAAPLWAGLIAVINAALGRSVGFINPTLYAAGATAFRDIVPVAVARDNGVKGVTGYPARPGWDACTGWGSPIGTKLLEVLRAAAPHHEDLVASAATPAPTETQAD